jgi:hypothetical protein
MEAINALANAALIPLTIAAIAIIAIATIAYKTGNIKLFNSTKKAAIKIIITIIGLIIIKGMLINLNNKVTEGLQSLYPKSAEEKKEQAKKYK